MNNFSNYDPNQMMLENFNNDNSNSGNNFMMSNPNIATVSNQMSQMNQFNQMGTFPQISNENIMSMANNIDSLSMGNPSIGNLNMSNPSMNNLNNGMGNGISNGMGNGMSNGMGNFNSGMGSQRVDLNGTSLNDLSVGNQDDNSSLIKSLTKEIISNLKDSNIDLYDKKDRHDDTDSESSSRRKKKKKDKSIKEDLQDYMEEQNPVPSTNKYLSMIFSDSFSVKDFFLLFGLYFLLSQSMIREFFAKYFTCLNPDDEGRINIQGVIVYGLILTVIFMLLKKVV